MSLHDTIMYFSGSFSHPRVTEKLVSINAHRLFTFASPREVHHYLALCNNMGRKARIMVDSGAFSTWNSGKVTTLPELIEYDLELLRLYPQHQFVFISLDVIPGERGRKPTEVEVKDAMRKSLDNFKEMRKSFPNNHVLPVYHSDDEQWLRDAFLAQTNYICLSMNQDLSEAQRVNFAKTMIVPGYYFHGLAATGNRMLTELDWYSVDSIGPFLVAAMGNIMFPKRDSMAVLPVSSVSPMRKEDGKHLDNMPAADRVRAAIEAKGYDIELLRTRPEERICWNIDMWNEFQWKKHTVIANTLF